MLVVPGVVPVWLSDLIHSFVKFAFTSSQRIRNSSNFEFALRHKGLTNKWFTVYAIDSKHHFARLGMIASKRIIPKAVNRNLAKRLIREVFRLACSNLPNLDFIVRIRRDLSVCNREEARSALLQLMLDSTKT